MNARLKLVVTALLLCLALALTVFCAVQTVQAFQRFQQEHRLVVAGDVRAIHPWMTVPYIARIYHVPESYLDQSLHISNSREIRRLSLRELAPRLKRPLNGLIQDVQYAILKYRKQHRGGMVTSLYLHHFLALQKQVSAREAGRRPQGSKTSAGGRPQGITPASTMIRSANKSVLEMIQTEKKEGL